MYGDSIGNAIIGFGILCAIAGAAVCGVAFWLIPWLWELLKPWLHAVTG